MRVLVITAFLLFAAIVWGWQRFAQVPEPRVVADDGGSQWQALGLPVVSNGGLPQSPALTFHTMHAGLNNNDELWIATAPQQVVAWSVEEHLYVPEGPTIDHHGRVYFSPLYPREDVSLVVLDGDTGERLWTLPHRGDRKGAGAPLILTDPDNPTQQIIYHATYHHAWAVTPEGNILWEAPTGLQYDGAGVAPHAWGMNYIERLDALISVTQDGKVIGLSRKSGKPIFARPFDLPGEPAAATVANMPPHWVLARGDKVARDVFGEIPEDSGLFTQMVRVIFGAGSEVSNYYAVDPNSGWLYIAATAPDTADGSQDGISANGALYAIAITRAGHFLKPVIKAWFAFDGGTGSTPTVSNDGKRVFVSDDNGNVIALDNMLNKLWEFNVGDQVAASIAVSSDNGEIYAVTRNDIIRLQDNGDSAQLVWRADLDVFPGHKNINALTPTITANGIAVSIGATREVGNTSLLKSAGFGLIDRATGKVRGFVASPEESISVTVVDADGGFTIAHSPVRRLGTAAILGERYGPIRGGITKFVSANDDVLMREAACSAANFQKQLTQGAEATPAQRAWAQARITALMEQARRAQLRLQPAATLDANPIALCARLGGQPS
jgi:hypothetical protein